MEEKKALVVDLNNVWNRYLYARKGIFKDAVISVLHLFRSIYQSQEFAKVFIVIDGKPNEHYDTFKEYKSNRKHNPDKYIPMKAISSVLCQYFNVVGGKHQEGDAVVAYIASVLNKKYDTYIFSNDKDFIQLMYKGIHIVTEFKNGRISKTLEENEALKKFHNSNNEPLDKLSNVLKYRVFKGDTSDSIPPAVPRLKDTVIRDIVSNYWVEEGLTEDILLRVIGEYPDIPVKVRLIQQKEDILRNYTLMNLLSFPENFRNNIQKIWYKKDPSCISEYVDKPELYNWA